VPLVDENADPVLVAVDDGSNRARLVLPADEDLQRLLSRGELINVGGAEYSVCANMDYTFDANEIPLCDPDNIFAPLPYEGTDHSENLAQVNVLVKASKLSVAYAPSVGETSLVTKWPRGHGGGASGTADTTGILACGDLLRIGHPATGRLLRVDPTRCAEFTDDRIPLATPDGVPTSLLVGDIVSSVYMVQTVTVTSGTADISTIVGKAGFRIEFGGDDLYHDRRRSGRRPERIRLSGVGCFRGRHGSRA
jgi:hypothetical protein